MSADRRRTDQDCGGMTRREVLSALARWSVPTVVTLSLTSRSAAAVSCPPCTRWSGTVCRACSVSDILRCRCEPCLGPDYCSGGSGAMAVSPNFSTFGAPARGRAPAAGQSGEMARALLRQRAARQAESQLLSPFGRPRFGLTGDSIFGGSARGPYGLTGRRALEHRGLRGAAANTRSLYERLRELDERRRR